MVGAQFVLFMSDYVGRRIALQSVPFFASGEAFIVRDLFCSVDWKRVPMETRIKLGSMFLDYVTNPANGIAVELLEKIPQNQQKYKKQ